MRKLIYAINLTLDGCCDHTSMVPDEDLFEYYIRLVRDAGLFVYGRKTYQLMVPFWPDVAKDPAATKSDRAFGQAFTAANKVVFSRSLTDADVKKGDKNASIARADLRDEILKLKQQSGNDILAGGVEVPSQLVELGLVDEFRFCILPVIAGPGRRLMEGINLPQKLRLKLVETKTFPSGSVVLRYLKQ
jgi:dihydrofolate reductase